jgi:thioesterase domain-containing protein/acyl carrier protein
VTLAPDRPAYLFFTSGTTGSPKGVVDCHRNVLHNIMRYTNNLEIGPDDRLSLIQSWAFSGTISSLFSALLNGATLCLYDLRQEGAHRLGAWGARERLTLFHAVPRLFESFVAGQDDLSSLRVIRLEGDKASPHHVALFKARFDPPCVLANGLGATETGLSRQYFVTHDAELPGDVVPVGYATADMEALIVDDKGREVAAGEVGEIRIRSAYLATGYWKQPNLTQERFLRDPHDDDVRIYRTGDVGRLRPDGCLDYLGRAGAEVKVHGQRVDTDAIEAALRTVPGIEQALVAAHDTPSGNNALIGYVVAQHDAPSVTTIRRELGHILPPHALPGRFVFLDAFPATAAGKVDRTALPPPSDGRPLLDNPFVETRNVAEVQLKYIWESALNIRPIGVEDDFFALGGDSLLATDLLLQTEEFFGVSLPLDTIWLERPTIGGFAEHLRDPGRTGFWKQAVTLQPHGDRAPLFCVHLTEGNLWPYRQFARHFGSDRPIYGLPARGADGTGSADTSIEAMAENCLSMMRRQQPSGPYNIVGYSSGAIIAYELARQAERQGLPIGVLGIIDSPPRSAAFASFADVLLKALASGNVRGIQERLYQIVLSALGLGRLRSLRTFGERHRWALWGYRPGSYSGSIVLVRAVEDPPGTPTTLGWERLIEGSIVDRPVTAPDHIALMEEPYVLNVSEAINRAATSSCEVDRDGNRILT